MSGRLDGVLDDPFRPFFLLVPLAAVAAVLPMPALWFGVLGTWSDLTPGGWHGHEQVFGFLTAALAGFLLTALPAWTATVGIGRRRLLLLVGLWAAGRVGFWLDPLLPAAVVAALDLPFLVLLLVSVLPALRPPERRPWQFVLALAGLLAVNGTFHASRMGWLDLPPERAATAGLSLFMVLIALALGRILPVTLRAALGECGQAATVRMAPGRGYLAALTLVLYGVAELVAPATPVTGWVALAAACAQMERLTELHHGRALLRPQVLPFYMAQVWMAVGLGGIGLAALGVGLDAAAVRHALGLGAAGTVAVTVLSIVSLRHTGRSFPLPSATLVPPLLIAAAALMRVLIPHAAPHLTALWAVTVPALVWAAAFAVWLAVFGRWLLFPSAPSTS